MTVLPREGSAQFFRMSPVEIKYPGTSHLLPSLPPVFDSFVLDLPQCRLLWTGEVAASHSIYECLGLLTRISLSCCTSYEQSVCIVEDPNELEVLRHHLLWIFQLEDVLKDTQSAFVTVYVAKSVKNLPWRCSVKIVTSSMFGSVVTLLMIYRVAVIFTLVTSIACVW